MVCISYGQMPNIRYGFGMGLKKSSIMNHPQSLNVQPRQNQGVLVIVYGGHILVGVPDVCPRDHSSTDILAQ